MSSLIRSPFFALPENEEVHVWSARVGESLPQLPEFERLLSLTERQKAARFLRPGDRERYVVAHGVLRQLLAQYLLIAPAEIVFEAGEFGKPAVVWRTGFPRIAFNMAHSGDVILYAITAGRCVGVDVEAVRLDRDLMEIAESQFASDEIETFRAAEPAERAAAFYRCWTLKEAYLKARGEGLGFPLRQFSVSFESLETPTLRWASDDPNVAERWSVFGLSPAHGYVGALIVEGRPMRLLSRCWSSADPGTRSGHSSG